MTTRQADLQQPSVRPDSGQSEDVRLPAIAENADSPDSKEEIMAISMARLTGLVMALSLVLITATAMSAFAQERIYIPLGSDGYVVVIDPQTDAIVGTIENLPAVHGLSITPDGSLLIAGSFDERPLDKLSAVGVDGSAEDEHTAHHTSPDTADDTTEEFFSLISIVDIQSKAVVRSIAVPGAVHHVAVNPNGTIAAATHPGSDRVSIIDLLNDTVIAVVETGALPNYAVFSRDGQTLFVTNAGDSTVSAIDVSDWTTRLVITVGTSPEHAIISPDGSSLFINNVEDGSVSVVDTANETVRETYAVGSTLHGIDISADGTTLFVAALGDDLVTAINLATGERSSGAIGPQPYHLAAIPSQGKLYVSSAQEPVVWVLDQETLELSGTIAINGKGHQLAHGPVQ